MKTLRISQLLQLFTFTCSLLLCEVASAQPHLSWLRTVGSNGFDFFQGMVYSEKENCIYAAGNYGELGGGTLYLGDTTLRGRGSFLVKYDFLGRLQWAKGFINSDSVAWRIESIACDRAGNVYCAGGFVGKALLDTIWLESEDGNIFIAKMNPAGKALWAKEFGYNDHSDDTDYAQLVSVDSKEKVYVSGHFADSVDFGNGMKLKGFDGGSYSVFLAQFDQDGKTLWAYAIGAAESIAGVPSIQTINSHDEIYLLAGGSKTEIRYRDLTVKKDSLQKGVFFLKIDSSGTPLWGKFVESGYRISYIIVVGDGGLYLAGELYSDTLRYDELQLISTHEPPSPPHTNYPYSDGFLIKLDKQDQVEWFKLFSGDTAVGIRRPFEIGGITWLDVGFYPSLFLGSDTLKGENGKGGEVMFLFDKSGNVKNIIEHKVYANILCSDSVGNYYIGDVFKDTLKIDGFSAVSKGFFDVFFGKVSTGSDTTGIENSAAKNYKTTIYPNPTTGSFMLSANILSKGDEIIIYNLLGKQVYSTMMPHATIEPVEISLKHIPTGVYQVLVSNNNNKRVSTTRLVILR